MSEGRIPRQVVCRWEAGRCSELWEKAPGLFRGSFCDPLPDQFQFISGELVEMFLFAGGFGNQEAGFWIAGNDHRAVVRTVLDGLIGVQIEPEWTGFIVAETTLIDQDWQDRVKGYVLFLHSWNQGGSRGGRGRQLVDDLGPEFGCIKTGMHPGCAVAGAVGAERSVAHSARICSRVAVGAGRIESLMMERNPVGIGMILRLRAGADLDVGDKFIRLGDYNRMAEVALQADSPFLGIEVLPAVAPEAAGCVFMTDVIGVRGPVRFLLRVDALGKGVLELIDSLRDLGLIGLVILRVIFLVILIQEGKGIQGGLYPGRSRGKINPRKPGGFRGSPRRSSFYGVIYRSYHPGNPPGG